MSKIPRSADNYLQTDQPELQSVFAKIKMLENLQRKVSPYLDSSMQKHAQVANLNGNTLVIITANGSTATQLRFIVPDLLRKFKTDPDLQHIQDIHCKVRPPQARSSVRIVVKPTPAMSKLSPETAAIVREIAESLDDEKLRKVMERIAERV